MLSNNSAKLRFKAPEFRYFDWIYNVSPCFPVLATKVKVITDPKKFYDSLYNKFEGANRRITVSSLYIGTGVLEERLLNAAKKNIQHQSNLKLNVLLDYQRGSRGVRNSVSLLNDLVDSEANQCSVALYQTPRLRVFWSKVLPSRYNELVGLQHMKLYIVDDSVLLSGANCSNDYFQQRQDRYIEIEDPDLSNFYCDLIGEVSKFSIKQTEDGMIDNIQSKKCMVQDLNKNVNKLIDKWRERQTEKIYDKSKDACDTWIFPMVQMGEFNIHQDEQITQGILASCPKGSYLRLATGYFNLTEQYATTLLRNCKANISLLMAHPNANGFLGAPCPAGGIPHAYSLIAKKFWERVQNTNQASRVQMLEYERPGWTFHAKGLWYYPPGSGVPWATIIGSANLGERSVRRDLEAQAAIFTTSPELQEKLSEEYKQLHIHAKECGKELLERRVPLWVRGTVGLFRTYF